MMMPEVTHYDLSHTIEDGQVTYRGLPAPLICDYWSREDSKKNFDDGSSFHIAKIELVSNTGTYLDCPFHRYADGSDLSELELSRLTNLEMTLIDADYRKFGLALGVEHFSKKQLKNKAVIVRTNWSEHWGSETYFEHHPYLTEDAASYLVEQGCTLVGIDSYNIDNTQLKSRPAHSILLKSGILIVEHLCRLDQLTIYDRLLFTAVPPKIRGVGTFPVRAFASKVV